MGLQLLTVTPKHSDLQLISCMQTKSAILWGKTTCICHAGTIYMEDFALMNIQVQRNLIIIFAAHHLRCNGIIPAE